MMLLLISYNVRSERELFATIPERLEWLWFIDYDIDNDISNHSVLSKARVRYGGAAFKTFFERIVWQCVQAGLVDGCKIFMDSGMVQANASNNSVIKKESLKRHHHEYIAFAGTCNRCQRKKQCTKAKSGRTLKRHVRQDDIDSMLKQASSAESKNDIRTRQHLTPLIKLTKFI
jgi:hypothetical protein